MNTIYQEYLNTCINDVKNTCINDVRNYEREKPSYIYIYIKHISKFISHCFTVYLIPASINIEMQL